MPSIFYKDRFERPVTVSLLLLERLSELFKKEVEADRELTDESVLKIVQRALQECCSLEDSTIEQVQYVLDRLAAIAEESKGKEGDENKKSKLTLASSYTDWVTSLETEQLCLLASNYDLFKAKRLYEEADRDDVLLLATDVIRKMWEDVKVHYESIMYGFGGSYKGDKKASSGDVVEYDLSKGGGEGLAALSKLL